MTQVCEARLLLNPRLDNYIVLSVVTLETLDQASVNNIDIAFKPCPATPGLEVLQRAFRYPNKKKQWSYMEDKEQRRVFRKREGGVTEVFWG